MGASDLLLGKASSAAKSGPGAEEARKHEKEDFGLFDASVKWEKMKRDNCEGGEVTIMP